MYHFTAYEARKQLEIAIDWGRYAELFAYNYDAGEFYLKAEEMENCCSIIVIVCMGCNLAGWSMAVNLKVRPDLTVPDMTAKIGSIGKQDHDDECE